MEATYLLAPRRAGRFTIGPVRIEQKGRTYQSQPMLFCQPSAVFFLLFVLENFRRPVNISYISDTIDHKTMASGLSVESQLKTLLMAILAPVIGFLADRLGVGLALILAGLLMAALFFLVSLRSAGRKGS